MNVVKAGLMALYLDLTCFLPFRQKISRSHVRRQTVNPKLLVLVLPGFS